MPRPKEFDFFNGVVRPYYSGLSAKARQEMDARIDQMLAVSSAPQRDAVRDLVKRIDNEMGIIRQGGDPWTFTEYLIGALAQKDTGALPFLGRVRAIRALASMQASGTINLEGTRFAVTMKEAIRSEPYPRGSLILAAASLGELNKDELSRASLNSRWFTPELDHKPDETEEMRWLSQEMIDYGSRVFARITDAALGMTLFRWMAITGNEIKDWEGQHDKPMAPKSIVRLNTRMAQAADGKWEERAKIPDPELQIIAAALGVPLRWDFYQGLIDRRNLTIIQSHALNFGDKINALISGSASEKKTIKIKRQGIGIDPVVIYDSGRTDEAYEEFNRGKNNREAKGLPDRVVQDFFAAGAVQIVTAIRAARRLKDNRKLDLPDFSDQQKAVLRAIDIEVKAMDTKRTVIEFYDSGEKKVETSVVASLADEHRRRRGVEVTEDQVRDSIALVAAAMLLGRDGNGPRIRGEAALVRMAKTMIVRSLPPEDLKEHSGLVVGDTQFETLRREVINNADVPDEIVKPS